MTFHARLTELIEKATKGPLSVVDLRPKQDRLTITNGVSVVCRIENRVRVQLINAEDEANAELITCLVNHAEAIRDLVVAVEEWQSWLNRPVSHSEGKLIAALAKLKEPS